MSDSKVFMFPDAVGGNSTTGFDPNLLFASMMNNGGFGGNGNWIWIIFLFFLYGWRGNGFLGNGNGDCNSVTRDLLMQAIQGNADSVRQLSTNLNCDVNAVQSAINSVQSSVCQVGNQIGLTGQQVINSVQAGNTALAQQIAQCCCDNKYAICQQTNTLQSAINAVANNQDKGFSAVAYETQRQTCDLKESIKDLSTQLAQQFASLETRALQDKITSLQETKSTLLGQISNDRQTAQVASLIAPLQNEIASIKCQLPETTKVSYQPYVAVPNIPNLGVLGLGLCGNNNGSIWS